MIPVLSPDAVRKQLSEFAQRTSSNAQHFKEDIPDYYDNGDERWRVNGGWTEGFWPGLLWSLYLSSGLDALGAEAQLATQRVAMRNADLDDHDLGFVFELSCVFGYRITADPSMRSQALAAARRLAARFVRPARYIAAHGRLDGPRAGFAIIDTVMNLPLLIWAAEETGENELRQIAIETASTIARTHVRGDGSSCQVLWFDPSSGQVVREDAVMAASVDSCWARGQAWGVHGFARLYVLTGERFFRETAERMAHYFLSRLSPDGVVFHDLDDPAAPHVPKDTSAQAITAGGLLALAATMTGAERAHWLAIAEKLLSPLTTCYLVSPGAGGPPRGLLGRGCKSWRKREGIRCELVFGDYYFVTALSHWLVLRTQC